MTLVGHPRNTLLGFPEEKCTVVCLSGYMSLPNEKLMACYIYNVHLIWIANYKDFKQKTRDVKIAQLWSTGSKISVRSIHVIVHVQAIMSKGQLCLPPFRLMPFLRFEQPYSCSKQGLRWLKWNETNSWNIWVVSSFRTTLPETNDRMQGKSIQEIALNSTSQVATWHTELLVAGTKVAMAMQLLALLSISLNQFQSGACQPFLLHRWLSENNALYYCFYSTITCTHLFQTNVEKPDTYAV